MSGVASDGPAVAEARAPEPHRRRVRWQWLVLGLLVLGHASFDAVFTPMGTPVDDNAMAAPYAVIGVIAVQPMLLAMWVALGRGPLVQRLFWAVLACVLVASGDALGSLWNRPGSVGNAMAGSVAAMLVLFGVAALALWPVRRLSGWRIGRGSPEAARPSQFGIVHLILWTTLTAVFLGAARFLGQQVPVEGEGSSWRHPAVQVALAAAFLLVALFPTVVVPWVTLAYRGRRNLLILAAAAAWAALTYACIVLMSKSAPTPLYQIAQPIVFLQAGASAAGLLSALVVRLCGYRIARYGAPP